MLDINHDVARLMEKLRVEFTKSRPRHTNDNALAESKNGSIIRKLMGDSHIPQKYVGAVNQFYSQTLNPYLNFHRPSYFALDSIDAKGKIKKTYPQHLIQTPFQRLQRIPDYARCLRPGLTAARHEEQSLVRSDNEAVKQVQQARKLLFQSISRRSKTAA